LAKVEGVLAAQQILEAKPRDAAPETIRVGVNLLDKLVQVIAHHHGPELSEGAQPLVALVHLSDLLCRMRGMGYGHCESCKVDLAHNPAWTILQKEYRDLGGVDLVQFTFELDEAVGEVFELVATIFGAAAARN